MSRLSRRPVCSRCERPLAGCLCACIRPLDNAVPLLILQHPEEARQAKGTARLLQLCLQRCERQVGEHFRAPAPDTHPLLLLYPPGPGATAPQRPALAAGQPAPRLVLLDGTWRQSRQLMHNAPWLQTLPRLALTAPPPSRYAIRKAHAPHQLSSLEAAALALAQLQPGLDTRALWDAMDAFVALQQSLASAARAGRH
ncbi:DTW domain-containing protein [Mitsuaria sp. WAJ17]|uniref:tRNA-uridine aminocarboxypropyltransferase n=1 Tax=Mitsuaria sp. WAJ17 TaxID=2761452 RepID=UPI001601E595|nr:tRNA-uridine aminocarboxypropyltransferase [Mitsuaria sp. WAJ17]MBB2487950.1 DTW domain-containing protein [Mitsuaria sp. WAJ17]